MGSLKPPKTDQIMANFLQGKQNKRNTDKKRIAAIRQKRRTKAKITQKWQGQKERSGSTKERNERMKEEENRRTRQIKAVRVLPVPFPVHGPKPFHTLTTHFAIFSAFTRKFSCYFIFRPKIFDKMLNKQKK